jgi:hypothetical protein
LTRIVQQAVVHSLRLATELTIAAIMGRRASAICAKPGHGSTRGDSFPIRVAAQRSIDRRLRPARSAMIAPQLTDFSDATRIRWSAILIDYEPIPALASEAPSTFDVYCRFFFWEL